MILIAGGTGRLGTELVRLLDARGLPLRVLTREPARAAHLPANSIEIVQGDVRDAGALQHAMQGADTVVSAIQGFAGSGNVSPETVDWQGNVALIEAARAARVGHFVLISIQGASPNHPMELFRMKYRAEEALKASGLSWTIVRPTAYMETWAALVGEPLVKTGKTRIFGRGNNPNNFISVHDVARYVELAIVDPAMRNVSLDVGGPENLTMRQVVQTFEAVTGAGGKVSAVPLPAMRLMSVLVRPINPALARQIQAGVVMDTADSTFDPTETLQRYPSITPITLAEMVRRDYGGSTSSSVGTGPERATA